MLIAATEQGDAALTLDATNQARIWPTLDGTREPVILHAMPAREVVLVRSGDGLLAAVLDDARGLELIRIDRDGQVRGRTRLAPEPGFDKITALGDHVLALRRDQVLVRLDADGTEVATLAVRPGERIREIATRGGHAIVGLAADTVAASDVALASARLSDHGPESARVRVLVTTTGLAWGSRHELRASLAGMLALSPSGTRVAGLRASDGQPVICELGPELQRIAAQPDLFHAGTFLGFLDETTLLMARGTHVRWAGHTPPKDPWVTPNLDVQGNDATLAIANGLVVGARGMSLQLADAKGSRYLGYGQLATGAVRSTNGGAAIATQRHITWLDRELRERATRRPVGALRGELVAVGSQHVIQIDRDTARARRTLAGDLSSVYLHGTAAQPPILLGTWPDVDDLTFDDATHVLAIPTWQKRADKQRFVVERFDLDLEAHTVRKLPALEAELNAVVDAIYRVSPLDPTLAHGLVAVATGADGARVVAVRFTEDGKSTRELIEGEASPMGVDRTGTAYFLRPRSSEITSVPVRGPRRSVFALIGGLDRLEGVVSRDGELLVLYGDQRVVAVDRTGVERWRIAPWRTVSAEFLDDDRTVVIGSLTGIVAVDAMTGKRRATACGFGFALSASLNLESFDSENVCTLDE